MVDFNKLVGSLTSSGVGAGFAGGAAGGALVSALTTKSGRKAVKSVAKVGGLAAVGALAWNAYKKYQGQHAADNEVVVGQATSVPPAIGSRQPAADASVWQQLPQAQFDDLASHESDSQGLLVLRTMIAAAMADGHLSPQEQVHIFDRLDVIGLTQEERSTLFDELRNPLSSEALAAQVTDPVLAIEIYSAAAMVLDTSCASAKGFLGRLAADLNLPDSLVASIHNNASAAQLANAS